MTAISLNNVSKHFGNIQAVNEVNIDIEDGEFITFVGPSGCGKTTTLRVVAGLETASGGTIHFAENDMTNAPPSHRNVGMVFQNLALYPHMTVRENMAFGLDVAGIPETEQNDRINEAARMLDIEELLDRQPSQLSGGQQQRIAIGRTIVLDPDVFLLDEPLASLDAKLRVDIREELQELQERIDVTTIYVTHDQEQAMTMSDRLVVMNEGEVQQFATPGEIYNEPSNEFVANFIGTPSMNFFDGTIKENDTSVDIDLGFHTVSLDQTSDIGPEGKEVRLGIRPEHVTLDPSNENGFEATVNFIEPTGKENIVHFDHLKEEFSVITPGEMDVDSDGTYGIVFEEERIHVFDAETTENIF
jgi:multiple sugar transport system ATP-binding protein